MAVLTVGSGQQFSSLSAAIAASQSGDTIQVQAGTYTNDFATIDHDLTIEAVGGRAHLLATEPPPNLKGILTIGASPGDNPNVTISGLSFAGCQIPAEDGNNGAGIRYQSGNLTLSDCTFRDNQNGLLATPSTPGTGNITIDNSLFSRNGVGDGQSHNIYVNDVANLTITNSLIENASVGHEIKSRAENTTIQGNRIFDGPNGTASYSIDLPNGGNAVIEGNIIEQGPLSQNPNIIAYGEEGSIHPGSNLAVSGNTIVNDLQSNALALWNASDIAATFSDNQVWGLDNSELTSGAVAVSGTQYLSARPALDTTPPWLVQNDIQPASAVDAIVASAGGDTISAAAATHPADATTVITQANAGAAGPAFISQPDGSGDPATTMLDPGGAAAPGSASTAGVVLTAGQATGNDLIGNVGQSQDTPQGSSAILSQNAGAGSGSTNQLVLTDGTQITFLHNHSGSSPSQH